MSRFQAYKNPSEITAKMENLVLELSFSVQMIGRGSMAQRKSVTIVKARKGD